MPTILPPTLGEIRAAVLDRCGLSTEGNIPRNVQGVIDERIRSAQNQLYESFPWLMTYTQRVIPLIDAQAVYDIPDDTEQAKIQFISVRRANDQYLYDLEPGIRPMEMNTVLNESKGMPLRYMFRDQSFFIAPAPDATLYDALVLEYYQIPNSLIEDDQRVVVDGECMKMLAEILVKAHFGGQDTTRFERDLEKHIYRIRAKQSSGDGFQMGGRQSMIGRPQRRNRFTLTGYAAPNWQDWRPW
jgi:hypothetical protein